MLLAATRALAPVLTLTLAGCCAFAPGAGAGYPAPRSARSADLDPRETAPGAAPRCPLGTRRVEAIAPEGLEVSCLGPGGATHGDWTRIRDGRVAETRTYVDGLQTGRSARWYPDGAKQAEQHWLAGVAHGPTAEWAEDGSLVLRGQYLDGLPHGRFLSLDESGRVAAVCFVRGDPVWRSRDLAVVRAEPCPPASRA